VLLVLGFFIFAAPAVGMDWQKKEKITVAWDKVTNDIDGGAFPQGSIIEYEVFISDPRFDPNKTSPKTIGVTQQTQLEVTITPGKYLVGVQAILKVPSDASGTVYEEAGRSAISWSDNPQVVLNGVLFGMMFHKNPAFALNLRPQ
jgi:hypothetical protein